MIRGSNVQKIMTAVIAVAFFSVSVWYLATTFQWREIASVLISVDLLWLVAAAVSIIFYWLARTMRWSILLRQLDVSMPFIDLYMCSAVAA